MLDAEREWAWDDKVYTYDQVVAVAQHAQVANTPSTTSASASAADSAQLSWDALDVAHRDYTEIHSDLTRRLRESGSSPLQTGNEQDIDMEALRKELDEHEQKLESCIVTPDKIRATSFNDVHLPSKTIDAIRSMVSLPLLYPEAFNSGVLKSHSTNGALLFGPPGTGKTLLARATAMEAGARMMVVKASDINDKWLGESEKQ
jgi:SpoVK/Ycf46/Vps4 family AAA+-type ATPase